MNRGNRRLTSGLPALTKRHYTSRMLRFCKMIVLCLALAALPVQVVAATGMALCLPDQHSHTHVNGGDAHVHAVAGTDDASAHGAAGDDILCHHCGTVALPALLPQPDAAAASDTLSGPATRLFLFFPEQPQRPPLA